MVQYSNLKNVHFCGINELVDKTSDYIEIKSFEIQGATGYETFAESTYHTEYTIRFCNNGHTVNSVRINNKSVSIERNHYRKKWIVSSVDNNGIRKDFEIQEDDIIESITNILKSI